MELTMHRTTMLSFIDKLKSVSDMCRISRLEKLLSDCLENMPNNSPVDYVGELNRNDIMH